MDTQEQKNTLKEKETVNVVPEHGQPAQDLLQKDLTTCKQALADWQEKYIRLSADFENYKKRMLKDQVSWMHTARVNIFTDLLSILDNFDRAIAHKKTAELPEMQTWIDGIHMIHKALQEFLKKSGVREVAYDVFDPLYHEALLHVDSEQHKSGHIVEVLQKGYMIDDQVIRPAKVSVAK